MKPIEPVHFSDIKEIDKSGAHYKARLAAEHGDSTPMRMGRGLHSLVLGGPEVVCYEGRRDERTQAWREFKAEHADAEILSPAEYRTVREAADSVLSNRLARPLIEQATDFERSLDWEREGFKCQGRLDFMRRGSYIGDLKSCRSAEPEAFWRDALRRFYHAQLAWYQDGAKFNGIDCPDAYFIAVEMFKPYAVSVIKLHPHALDYGNRRCNLWLERLRQCREANYWPAYSESILTLDVPDSMDDEPLDLDWGDNNESEAA